MRNLTIMTYNKKCIFYFISILLGTFSAGIAQQNPNIALIEDYNTWGWDTWVMENDLVTIATVPVIGARIMQYDLGEHSSIYVNSAELGNTYTPSSSAPTRNFGGFKNWPAPQSVWNWPPPPTLDYGVYEAVADTFPDSVRLTVTSPIEEWRAPDLRFQRKTTIYKGTSHIKVEQTIINEKNELQRWSVWDITQSITQHGSSADFENFWVYFPINPDSRYGESGVYLDLRGATNPSKGWVGEVAPGIYGVQYSPDYQKLFADSHIGWICYVDEQAGYAYAKTFDIFEGAEYPDDGAHVEVWLNQNPYYIEVEVVSPIVDLPANGGSYTFTEDWWAAKVNGPILAVTNAGAVKSFEYEKKNNCFTGEFGVFHLAKARLEFTDQNGSIIDSSSYYDVTPLETFVLNDSSLIHLLTDSVHVVLRDSANHYIGTLISASIEDLATYINLTHTNNPENLELLQNYPNPFNPTTTIQYQLATTANVNLIIYNLIGQKVDELVSERQSAGKYTIKWDATSFASGVYFYQLQTDSFSTIKKMILIK